VELATEALKMTTAERLGAKIIPASTTGIGSLPHHNIDAALGFSFRSGIAYLPQIPLRNPWEYMIAQALEDLPGLRVERDGEVSLNLGIWKSQSDSFRVKLNRAFEKDDVSEFEPSQMTSSSWHAFLWELQEQKKTVAKIQIAGPLTCQWVIGSDVENELSSQVFKLVLAKSLAMGRKIQTLGITPLLFLDEPGLYAFDKTNPKHVLAFQELKLLIQTLKKNGIQIGLHCCSNTDWKSILTLGLNFLSIDTELSLESLIKTSGPELALFVQGGGRLSLGIVPSSRSSVLHSIRAEDLFKKLQASLSQIPNGIGLLILKDSLLTPACGLALQSTADAEYILDTLNQVHELRKAAWN
jgi:methionine synthase II (cobalamin-independent)